MLEDVFWMYLLSPVKMHHNDEMKRVLNKVRHYNPRADLILGPTPKRPFEVRGGGSVPDTHPAESRPNKPRCVSQTTTIQQLYEKRGILGSSGYSKWVNIGPDRVWLSAPMSGNRLLYIVAIPKPQEGIDLRSSTGNKKDSSQQYAPITQRLDCHGGGLHSYTRGRPLSVRRPVIGLTYVQSASYPTGSLDFLVKLQKEEEKRQKAMRASSLVNGEDLSRLKLNIIIVGAGLGGLAAAIALSRRGHKVTVFEQAPELGEVRGVLAR